MIYADIIVDISHESLDKTYQYTVPKLYESTAVIGALVEIFFGRGNRLIKGYIIGLSEEPKIDTSKIKSIIKVVEGSLVIESRFIKLAYWLKDNYGATMNDALKTVLPVKKSVRKKEKKTIVLIPKKDDVKEAIFLFEKKHNVARVRLLKKLLEEGELQYEAAIQKLNISRSTIQGLENIGIIKVEIQTVYRNPVKKTEDILKKIPLNKEQRKIADTIILQYRNGERKTSLIYGITGSGKTEVYMEVIEAVVSMGKQAIMLIPEIALTYQTVMRFYQRFGERISILHSRMSGGERYDQYLRAKNGEIDIMIGPRSALFTPFCNLGLIVIDEEHESSYKSENPPKYHARETALELGRLSNAMVILGSATPSIEAYKKAQENKYQLFTLEKRANNAILPKIWVADLRKELQCGNKSILSRKLKSLMQDRLMHKQQIMLFINRRGYAGFVSCRNCGYVIKCPHCEVSLTFHKSGKLICHYCGYEELMPKECPSCSSKYIAAFGTGTQKVEELVKKEFPSARILRMDTDTTTGKDGHEKILAAFANQEADILVGTQMIVKGHDFPAVTLVGIIAADLSLYANDYRAGERTFQLLCQAAGRAGRGEEKGEVVIQTYNPNNYSIVTASKNDYKSFYQQEILYRTALSYPPIAHILVMLITSKKEEKAEFAGKLLAGALQETFKFSEDMITGAKLIGPTKAALSKVNDIYRQLIYIKCEDYEQLKQMKDFLESYIDYSEHFKGIFIQFDFDPMNSY